METLKNKNLEIMIAQKTVKLIDMVSLGTANRFMGNSKNLGGAAAAMRKASNKPEFQALITEIEQLQWMIDTMAVEKFQPTGVNHDN